MLSIEVNPEGGAAGAISRGDARRVSVESAWVSRVARVAQQGFEGSQFTGSFCFRGGVAGWRGLGFNWFQPELLDKRRW